MPLVKHLAITAFRNLRSASLEPGEGINLIVGDNGSGKTSLLESISVLAHGKSFRTHKYRRLINNENTQLTLFSLLEEGLGQQHKIGLQRSNNGDIAIRIDGRPAYSTAELAQQLPLLILNAGSFQLLEGSSKYRRQFFDWLVFHVKHEFKSAWKDYAKCIKHRNSLLRRGKIGLSELSPWDKELTSLASAINQMRVEVFAPFAEEFNSALQSFPFTENDDCQVSIGYQSGWAEDGRSYTDQLQDNLERDFRLGYTSIGAQKADIKIQIGRVPAAELLSRGQQKSVILGLYLAEARVFGSLTGRKPVFLLDDLPSELDNSNLAIIGTSLNGLGYQIFVTAIEPQTIMQCWGLEADLASPLHRMFHVEHGEIRVSPMYNQETDSSYE